MQNLYASEKRASERQEEQPEQKATDSSEEASDEQSTQAKAPRSMADVLNEMRESAAFRIDRDVLNSKRQKDQDDAGQQS